MIELLLAVAIIVILTTISLVSISSANATARDSKRKADLAAIQSALEMYRNDCLTYPASLPVSGSFTGTGASATCSVNNIYLKTIPTDPKSALYAYSYAVQGSGYGLCAHMENPPTSPCAVSNCGSNCGAGQTCNYAICNP